MNEFEVLKNIIENRHCKRAFTQKQPEKSQLEEVLKTASEAASSKNTQPWYVDVVMGEKKDDLVSSMLQKFDQNEFEKPDYDYAQNPLPEHHLKRARACGFDLFALKGIGREDKEKRIKHMRENYELFGAPGVMCFFLDANALSGSFLDLGLFMQNVMLQLTSLGMASCPQYSLTSYTQTIKEQLVVEGDKLFVCGLSFGYPDNEALVNTFIPKRASIEEFIRWH